MRKAIVHLKKSDPILSSVIKRVGPFRMEFREPEFETLVRSIVYQQLSGKVAAVIFGRLLDLVPKKKLTPKAILKLKPQQMRRAGLSNRKTAYIRDLAAKTAAGLVDFGVIPSLSDDEVIETLTQIKGVGVWTAHMFLIFALRRPNILPTGDLGIRMAIKKIYNLDELPRHEHMEEISGPWHPYRSVATWYLWRSLDGGAEM